MTKRCVFLMIMVLLGLIQTIQTRVQADNEISSFTTPFTMPIFAECLGETVVITGEAKIIFKSVFDANEGIHTNLHIILTGTGLGQTTGTKYKFSQETSRMFNSNNPPSCSPQIEVTDTDNIILLSLGSSPNLKVHVMIHFTVSASCQISGVSFTTMSVCCLGPGADCQ
jgi:hypothetical protein